MKKLFLGSMALAAMVAGPAMAADMPVKALPPPPALYDWSGAYIGFNIGGMSYDVDRTFPNRIPLIAGGGILPGFTTNDTDGIFGFHAGAQWQWGSFVFGVEAALSGCFEECRAVSGILPPPFLQPGPLGEHKITNLFTVGPRIGFAWDRFLVFATGGAASADLKGTYCNSATNLCGVNPANLATFQNGTSWNWGWFVGGGFDYMIHKGALVDVILGVEYQHWEVDTDRAFTCAPAGAFCGPLPSFRDYDLGASGDLVRARLTIKTQGWGFWGPPAVGKAPVAVMARY